MKKILAVLACIVICNAYAQNNDPEVFSPQIISDTQLTFPGSAQYCLKFGNNGFRSVKSDQASGDLQLNITFNKSELSDPINFQNSISGTGAQLFNWQYNPDLKIIRGTLTSPIASGTTYTLAFDVRTTQASLASDVGFNANIVPSFTANSQGNNTFNDAASVYNRALPAVAHGVCDSFGNPNDGIHLFNLNDPELTTNVLGGLDPNTHSITYHETEMQAQQNTDPLGDSYTNTSNPQIIYSRINGPQDHEVKLVRLEVAESPVAEIVEDYRLDDTNGDGIEVFDLTQKIPEIVGSQTGITVSFYESLEEAQEGINAIASPNQYTNIVNPQTIFVRLQNETGCHTLTSFVLLVENILDNDDTILLGDLVLYPNPATHIAHIRSGDFVNPVELKVFNVLGQYLFSTTQTPQNSIVSMDVGALSNGVYFVKITYDGILVTKSFIKE